MKIDFEKIEKVAIPQFKNGEGETEIQMFLDTNNRIMKGELKPGCSIGIHTHQGSSEIVYVLSGTGKARYDGVEEPLGAGDCHYCEEGHEHSLINDGDETLRFFAVVPNH